MEIIKSYKIKLIKPINDDWKFVGKILNDTSYMVKRIKNKTATETFINNINGMNGIPKLNATGVRKRVYKELSDIGIDKYGSMISVSPNMEVFKKVNTDFYKIVKGEMSLPNFKDGQPISIPSQQIAITKKAGQYYCKLSLLSREYSSKLGRKGRSKGRIEFLMSSMGQEKIILDKILSGEYKLCDSLIKKGKDKEGKSHWYLVVSYSFEKDENKNLIPNRVLGIDMGINKAVYMAVSDSPANNFIEGGEIEQYRNRIEHRRNQMRNQLRTASENRLGHGRETFLKPLEKLETKVSDFRKLTNHRYAKYVVDYALKHHCSIIQMEELSGINSRSAFLKRWSYFDLQSKIKSKAEANGIKVIKVNPKFTSQRCYNCGVINKDNRKNQALYECTCERRTGKGMKPYKTNADLNAARNLSILGIDQIIKEQCKSQGINYGSDDTDKEDKKEKKKSKSKSK